MNLTANVIGATGLVGKQLVNLLLNNTSFSKVRIFVRRESGLEHSKLEQQIIDFRNTDSWERKLKGDVLFSALGTTLKQAGSKEKEYEVDYTYNLNFAQVAKKNGIENYVLVSSIGANPDSWLFYPRMKGELDESVSKIGFSNLVILRPSSLLGDRSENRPMEKISIPVLKLVTSFILKKYRPIKGKTVAQAMINGILQPVQKTIWEGQEVFELANIHS